jgi:hypothetical protein
MRSPIASAAFGVVLTAGIALLGAPAAHAATPAPAVSASLCADARLSLGAVTTDLNNALGRLDGVTATVDELTRRLGLGTLVGTPAVANEDAVARIRAVLTLKAAKVLAEDRVATECADEVIVVVPPSSTSSAPSSSSGSATQDRQTHRRPARAPETGDGSSLGSAEQFDTDNSLAPVMALYALLSVGVTAAVYVGRLWLRGR